MANIQMIKKQELQSKKTNELPQWITLLKNNGYIIDDECKIYKEPQGIQFDNINYGLYEVFYNKDYELFFNKEAVLFDIGLNIGMTSLFFARNEKINKIYSFEPFAPTYKLAVKNIEKNPSLKFKIETYNFGLDKEDNEFEMPYSSAVCGCMSTSFNPFEINNKICKTVEKTERIKVKKASNILKPIIEKHIANGEMIILKVDTEGAEFSIFEDLDDNNILQHVDIVMLEYHFKSPKPLMDVLVKNNFIVRLSPTRIKQVGMIFAYKLDRHL